MPFAGGLESLPNGTLLFSFVAALVYLLIVSWPPSPRRTICKTLSTALLALLVALEGGPTALFVALVLGALGDAFLAQNGKHAFLAGLTSFLLAHLVYVWLFWFDGAGFAGFVPETWRVLAATVLVAFAVVMFRLLMANVESDLRFPVAVYVVAILLMGLTAFGLDRPLVIAGAAMFIVSDALLATEKFLLGDDSSHRHWMPYAVWAFYYLGQLAIVLGFLL